MFLAKRRTGGGTDAKLTGDATAKSAAAASDYKEARKKMEAEVQKSGDKKPCHYWFVGGACNKGADCSFHHAGKAGSYKPK